MPLKYNNDNLLDVNGDPVMMPWEGQIMSAHADLMSGNVLNVGFGIGLIDGLLQKRKPSKHYIIEAHPDVHAHIKKTGWPQKPGVEILFGRWQDAISRVPTGSLDAVFYDTHDEGVEDFLHFALEAKRVLKPSGFLSFWNAYNAHNIFLHAVHCKAVTASLSTMGFETRWRKMPVAIPEETWKAWGGVKNWYLNAYHLPVCTFPFAPGDGNQPPVLALGFEEGGEGLEVGGCVVLAEDMDNMMRSGIEECANRALADAPAA